MLKNGVQKVKLVIIIEGFSKVSYPSDWIAGHYRMIHKMEIEENI